MSLVFGQRMVRLDDGMKGVVIQDGPDLRVAYLLHGEQLIAPKSEKWVADELKPGPMQPVERFMVAACADRALRAYECNEPHKYWETIPLTYKPYDAAFMEAVENYLEQRETRAAG